MFAYVKRTLVSDADRALAFFNYSNLDEFWRLEFRGHMEDIRWARELREFGIGP